MKCFPPSLMLAIVALLLGSAMDVLAERSPLESNNTIDLKGLTYTVTRVSHTSSIRIIQSLWDLPVTIKDSEAADHIGEKVEVRGVVSGVHTSRKGHTFINLGGRFPDQLCAGFVPATAKLSADSAFLKSLEGKEVSIIGRIRLYQAKPVITLIKVRTKDQIKVNASQLKNGIVG